MTPESPSPPEQDLSALLRLLFEVGRQCQGLDDGSDRSRNYALGFGLKLLHHGASTVTLLRDGSALGLGSKRFIDRASVSVLARAGWETFLLFHHLFVSPQSAEERDLRCLRWSIESPRARQHYEVLFPGQAEQLAAERREIEEVENRIRTNRVFLAMDAQEQNRLLNNDQYRPAAWRPGWRELGRRAGLAKLYRDDHYNYLCDHAHSGWFSLDALRGPTPPEAIQLMRESVAGTLAVAAANVINGLWQLFPSANGAVSQADRDLVAMWVAAGRTQDVDAESAVPPAGA